MISGKKTHKRMSRPETINVSCDSFSLSMYTVLNVLSMVWGVLGFIALLVACVVRFSQHDLEWHLSLVFGVVCILVSFILRVIWDIGVRLIRVEKNIATFLNK